MRDDVHAEARALGRVDGETHPVDCDRALRRQVAREDRGRFDGQPTRARIVLHGGNARDAIDVAREQMPAECIARPQCGLEVHASPGLEIIERGERERLPRHISGKGLAIELNRGEAATLYAQAVPDAHGPEVELLAGDHQSQVAASRLAGLYSPDILNDP